MSREDWVAIAARLLAIYLLVGMVRGVIELVQLMGSDGGMQFAAWQGATVFLQLLVASVLWFFPLTVARNLLPAMSEPRSESSISPSLALSLGLTLIGAWFVINALTDTAYWISFYLQLKASSAAEGFSSVRLFQSPDRTASVITTGVELVVGLALILGASGLQRLIFRMRYGKDAI